MINKKGVKEKFKKIGVKISKKAIEKFIKIEEEKISKNAEKIARNARISGRKIVGEEDLFS